ncbi:major facilitator superfamily domain-containing protein [Microdochium bolleyi]|uniref:Major facilitator superfamily domain-containing protein n=1 Tax=Microdochium bolleyi TaxID=196109 RepID=A0A136IKR2_9PEZI|nr:major facilitator superfamily domain-containing protein [Microdochium bolleyi]
MATKGGFYRSVLAQMIIAGFIALLGPGLWNANNSLGAGGALEPYLVNAGNSLVFGFMGLFCILSPVFVNWIGVKKTLIAGTLGWSIYSAALYQNNRYGTEWFVILGAVICGISAGLYWAAEGAIVLSYPQHSMRGRYLALWLGFKNSGQLIGGAINLGLNANNAAAGKVSYVTILVFVALQAMAALLSFLLSPPEKAVRSDGSKIVVDPPTPAVEQLRRLWKTVSTREIGLLLPIFFSCWFYWGYASTFLTLYFSVRARALASFLSAITGTLACILFGIFLDSDRLSVKTRLRYGFIASAGPFTLLWIWVMVVQHGFEQQKPATLDWASPGFGRAFGVYIMLQTIGNLVQNYLYFLVGTIGDGTSELSRYTGLLRGVESWGQCASFGISSSKFSPFYTTVINVVFWTVSLVPAAVSIWEIQGRKELAPESASDSGAADGIADEKAEPASKV